MAKKTQIERAIETLEAKKTDARAYAERQCAAIDSAIEVLRTQRPKPRTRRAKAEALPDRKTVAAGA